MGDEDKTREQLISELVGLRQRVAELETLETERKQAEEALRESKELFEKTFISQRDAIFILDAERPPRIIDCNPRASEIFGYTREEILGCTTAFLHEDEAALRQFQEYFYPAIEEAGFFGLPEFRMKRKDGTVFPTAHSVVPLKDKQGKRIGWVSVVSDITERKRAEEALRESEERYRSLVSLGGKVGEAIVMLQDTEQGDAIQTFVSSEWPRITGYSRKELLGMSFFDLLHPEYRQASLERHRRKMSGESVPGLFEMSIIRKDGTEVPIELTSAYTTYQGRTATVAFIRDITERKRAEEREKELQQELNLSSRLASIGELAAGVAHEINNPLTGVIGFAERLLRKCTDEGAREGLEIIHSEALRAANVVQNLLTFARRRKPKKEYSDINDILQKALELRAYELKTSNIEVVADLAPSLPKTMVDFRQIQQVFLNIILNAEQAITGAKGRGKLSIKTQETKGYVRISFVDDGPGIPAEFLDKVFDPFFTMRVEGTGTGLGLSACRGIIVEHDGRIYARSKPGKGATFFVELPITTEEVDESKIAEE